MIGLQELPTVRKHKRLNEYSSASNLSAAFSQSWHETPISSIWRDRELRLANIGQGEVKYTYTNPLMGQDIAIPQTQERKQLSKEEVEARIKKEGLPLKSPEEGYTEEALDLIVERKRNEIYRADQMSRAKGFVAGTGEFAAAMAAQILDPINIAASFIPVVGPARYTSMLAKATTRLGRAGVRARVGAIEGVVGAAIVEPLVYRAMTREQADYDMYDSLLNVGLGAVVGGGLHSGFGAIADAITKGTNPRVALQTKQPQGPNAQMLSKASPETKRSMLSTAISQEIRGVPTNIEPILALDPKTNFTSRAMSVTSEQDIDVAMSEPVPLYSSESNALENAIKNEVKRGSDPVVAARITEEVNAPEMDVAEDIEFLNSSNDELSKIYGQEREVYNDIDEEIKLAEQQAAALEAAVMCRVTK